MRLKNRKAFKEDYLGTLPNNFHNCALLLYDYNRYVTTKEKEIADNIESFRMLIPKITTNNMLESYSSPHPGTFQKDYKGHSIPISKTKSHIKAHMKTGINKKNGILLRRIIQGLNTSNMLELGTNTGFSGCYFLSLPKVDNLITVEGSKELCEIAAKNLNRISSNFKILNMLFDDAIDLLKKKKQKFDCVFIDGQHEREAVLHYIEQIVPLLNNNAAFILDDIYWSNDMNQCWKELCDKPLFSRTLDFRSKGVCVLRSGAEPSKHHDICKYIGYPAIYRENWS